MADWGDGMFAGCTTGLILRWRKQLMTA